MKITAEFNSNEELLSFINTFGANNITKIGKTSVGVKATEKVITKDLKKVSEAKASTPDAVFKADEKVKVIEPEKEPQITEKDNGTQENKTEEINKKEEHKVTKEEVRAVFAKLIKEGKQKEAKDLTAKYGVSRLPDIEEKDYAAIKEEAEALL